MAVAVPACVGPPPGDSSAPVYLTTRGHGRPGQGGSAGSHSLPRRPHSAPVRVDPGGRLVDGSRPRGVPPSQPRLRGVEGRPVERWLPLGGRKTRAGRRPPRQRRRRSRRRRRWADAGGGCAPSSPPAPLSAPPAGWPAPAPGLWPSRGQTSPGTPSSGWCRRRRDIHHRHNHQHCHHPHLPLGPPASASRDAQCALTRQLMVTSTSSQFSYASPTVTKPK